MSLDDGKIAAVVASHGNNSGSTFTIRTLSAPRAASEKLIGSWLGERNAGAVDL